MRTYMNKTGKMVRYRIDSADRGIKSLSAEVDREAPTCQINRLLEDGHS